MKLRLPLLLLLLVTVVHAQHRVGAEIKALQNSGSRFFPYTVLTELKEVKNTAVETVLTRPTYAQLNSQALLEIYTQRPENIEVTVPFEGLDLTVQLYRVNPFAEGFHVDTDKSKNVAYTPGVYYRGIIKGDYESVASFNFFEDAVNAVISGHGYHNVVVGKMTNSSDYLIYSDAKMKVPNPFSCATEDKGITVNTQPNNAGKSVNSTRCATMYFEIDNNIYVQNGSDVVATTNWMTSVFNNVQTLFANDNITVALRSLYIWTTPDPYEGIGTSSTAYLYKFNQVRPVFDGDVGQLIGIDDGGLGGLAVTINGICTSQNFCYSDVEFDYNSVPTYSWTIEVITHEFGHLLGSPHTHACVWNGNNTAIDNCATAGQGSSAEGYSCRTTPLTIPASGTIMSYCHIVSNVGIDFSNGFGSQPAQRIIDTFDSSLCLSTDCINTCINTIETIVVESTTLTTATLSWIDNSGATQWNIRYYLNGAPAGNWTTVSNTTATFSNLVPNTYYVFEVTPICPNGLEIGGRTMLFMTADSYCTGSVFTDTGGASGDYDDEQTLVRTLIPNIPSNNITLSFSVFNLELDYDYMYIYDGNSTAAPEFNNGIGFTGNSIPGPFESSAADGSLTIQFKSDQFVTEAGWVAAIGCTPNLNTTAFQGIDFTYAPNPTNGVVQIQSKTALQSVAVYNVTGQLLYTEALKDTATNVDISSFAPGTYFFSLQFDEEHTVHFKVIKK
ncbi:MAG: hypothetical protein RLZZ500_363 [Bacteroidota bacterium]